MELKKSEKANLENKRNMFFLIGLVIALGSTLVAFEWSTKPSKTQSLGDLQSQEVEDVFIPITREQQVEPPPPPPAPKVIEVLNIVDDDVEIDEELDIEDSDADETTVIDIDPIFDSSDQEEEVEDKIHFNIIEEPAEFPGGDKALHAYMSRAVKYPIIAQENGIQGKVYVKFVVNEQGKVSNGEILRGVDPSLDKEALRVVSTLPDFKPGKQRGKTVKVFYNAVINFTLQ
jgi:protein TonB